MTRRRALRRTGTSGFTLLETLIALALMAAVLGALATVTAQWLPNWNRGFDRVQRTELFTRGLERLVADIAAAEFVPSSRDTTRPLFFGNEQQVMFVRTAIGPGSSPGLEILRIAETADRSGVVMVRMRSPFVPLPPAARIENLVQFADPVVLVREPYRLSFAYAGSDRVWRDRWESAEALPRAVRLRIRDAESAQVLAVSTVALVRAEVPVDCVNGAAVPGLDCGLPRRLETNDSPGRTVQGPAPRPSSGGSQ